jgi:PAS domain S-box-containing protein
LRHELPELEKLLKRHFYFTDIKNVSEFTKEKTENLILFCQHQENDIRCLEFYTFQNCKAHHMPLEDMPWQKVALIDVSSQWDWAKVRKMANNADCFLFAQKNKPIGYIEAKDLLPTVLSTYAYLKAYFDTILNTMDESVSVIDENKKTVVWTRGAEKIFSIPREKIIGRPMTDFFPKNMLETYKTMETGESVYQKQHQPREDLFVLINTQPILIDEQIVGAVAVETDVTSQVLLNEQLTNANHTIHHLRHEVSRMRPQYNPFYTIKGSSPAIKKTIEKARQIGTTQARVLILGESGVGKELFAKAIHDMRERSHAPFIPVNCGAIPTALFESELFGYEKGAFSGADSRGRKGKIEMAQGGTLFLDEVGELPLDVQVKLLRFLQEGTYYRVGGTELKRSNCRVIAATNQDLKRLVQEGKFRDDLYFRLNIVSLEIPPLRERTSDIVELSHYFLYEYGLKYGRNIETIPKEIMAELLHYSWPGNIRELSNVIERLVVFSKNGKLNMEDLPFISAKEEQFKSEKAEANVHGDGPLSLKASIENKEKAIIEEAIKKSGGNKNKAAKLLGISRATLYNKMAKFGI